ncbi:divergent polysaccharide deacetylase family protein [Candidatus Sordicultor fermentans]|uniref:divergent polysaccharide deacetylase family protein n=1 Tax=Candidatus Sordicultor fermentans TaxID=1953203 RepID=UPI0016AEE48A|nr:divergent polysaccharide deacetylase family protein [Candidatus Atribacteria bacterium]
MRKPWFRKPALWVILFLLIWSLFLLWGEWKKGEEVSNHYLTLARLYPQNEERYLALFLLEEIKKDAPLEVVKTPEEGGGWEVQVTLTNQESREEFSQKMLDLFQLLSSFGFVVKQEKEGGKDFYSIFRGAEPWFFLETFIPRRAQIALVIDDLGYNLEMAERFLDLPVKLNVAIFPHLPLAKKIASLAEEKGKEILIHFPMEAEDDRENSGEAFLLRVGEREEEVREKVEEVLRLIPQAKGINNHKGSRATSDYLLMSHFMESLKGRGVYFLDSLTSSHSLAYRLASQKGIPSFCRDVFLDGELSLSYVIAQLQKTVEIAKKNGQAIAIGHPNEVTYEAIYQFVSNFSEPGVEIVFLSEMEERN